MKNTLRIVIIFIVACFTILLINYIVTPVNLISNGFQTDINSLINVNFISENGINKLKLIDEELASFTYEENDIIAEQKLSYEYQDGLITINSEYHFILLSEISLFGIKNGDFYYAEEII